LVGRDGFKFVINPWFTVAWNVSVDEVADVFGRIEVAWRLKKKEM